LNAGLGAVTQQNIKMNNERSADCLNAIKHGNGRDWWVINKFYKPSSPNNHFNRFYTYLVQPDSIFAPITQDFNDASDYGFQKIIWHPNSDKFMLINAAGYIAEFNFDRCTGTITLDRTIFQEQTTNYNRRFWEGAYSPNGDVFYTSTTVAFSTDTFYIVQYDLSSTNIPSSCDTIDKIRNPVPVYPGALRLAPDNKIYLASWYGCNVFPYCYPYPDSVRNSFNENLTVINYPDSLGAACGYAPYSFYLGGKRTYVGLPNNPNYSLGPLVGSPCDTLLSVISKDEVSNRNVQLSFYPNPGKEEITFTSSVPFSEDSRLVLYNAMGKETRSYALPPGQLVFKFSASSIPGGVYACQVISASSQRQIEKLVILK